jgi:K+-transporting ATPase ATPase C chain
MSDETHEGATERVTPAESREPLWLASGLVLRQGASAIILTLVLTVVTGLLYPLVTGGLAQALFPAQANGSIVSDQSGVAIGSELIGQQFTQARYFQSRPSAAGDKGYDATSSGASNLGPTNPRLVKAVEDRAAAYRRENGLSASEPIPPDAVTASGSGLDPDVSPANALLQVHRVAVARGLADSDVGMLVEQHVEGRALGIFGEPRVNVLDLNLALDQPGHH